MTAAYLKVNREEKYILLYVAHWLDALRVLKNIDIYIVCDKESIKQMLTSFMDLHDVHFLKSNTTSADLHQITKNAIIEKWHPAAYAHLTVFEHAWEMKYDDFWNIDADDTEICVPPERVAEIMYVVRDFALKNHIQLFSLDMWRTVLLGNHWSFGITYTSNGTNWIQLMKEHCKDQAFKRDFEGVSSGRNVDWFITYIKSICDVKIETFCFENMWYNHHSDYLYRQADFGLNYFNNGRKVFPMCVHFYGMNEQGSLPIAEDVIQLDIGLTMEESIQYLRDTSFSQELINNCMKKSSELVKCEPAFNDSSKGIEFLDRLMFKKDILYVICPFNIGDFLVNGGLCYALQIKKKKTSCVLIVCDKFKNSGFNFVGVTQILYIPQGIMFKIRDDIISTGQYETNHYIYGHFHVQNDQFDWDSELSFFDRYRENVFGLPLETEILPPLIEEISGEQKQKMHALYQISKRTIILTPYANTSPQVFSDAVWIEMVKRLQKQGYTMYTNVAGANEVPVQGTEPIRLTFSELNYVADKVKCFIGRRSGILDFLAFSDAEILCILYADNWHDDLRINFPNKKSYSFYYAGYYNEILSDFAKEKQIADITQVQVNFPHVDPSEVFYEESRLVDAVVSTVEAL